MKKQKIIYTIIVIFIILLIMFFGGVSFGTRRFIFTTKYYETPRQAFEEDENFIVIQEDVCVYEYDDYNKFYVALNDKNELLIAKMYCKEDGYYYTGDYVIYHLNHPNIFLNDSYIKDVIFKKNGFYEKEISWKLIFTDEKVIENETDLIYMFTIDVTQYYVYFSIL